jgi:hypothetical protein
MRVERFVTACLLTIGVLAGCGKTDSGAAVQRPVTITPPTTRAAAATATPSAPSTAPQASPETGSDLPSEVVAFREQRDNCDHFRGEEAPDAKRAAFLAAEMTRTCAGTDRVLADLRKRYAGDARVIDALKDYEDKIE